MQGKRAIASGILACGLFGAALSAAAWMPAQNAGWPAGAASPSAALAPASAAPTTAVRFTREANLDRSGNDIRSERLAPESVADDCERRCAETKGCRAYTFVKLSATVPAPICWLKDTVPHGYPSSCCTSGVRVD